MDTVRFVYWKQGDWWLGYLEEYPDYLTQGEDLDDLQAQLRDLHQDLSGELIPNLRRVGALRIA